MTADVDAPASGLRERTGSWVLPIGFDRSPDSRGGTWTRVGTVDGVAEAVVDPCGLVSPRAGGPSVDWWIAGDERWYFPSREPTVRQALVQGAPVVETRMRVPGGDAVHRVYGIRRPSSEGGGEALVIEVENDSAIPFGLALAVRPFTPDGTSPIGEVVLDGARVKVDGTPLLVLPKLANRAIAGTLADGDLADAIVAGAASSSTFAPTSCPDGGGQAAVIVPIAHRTTFRVVVPLPDGTGHVSDEAGRYPSALPTAALVAEGWRTQVRDLARVVLPDPRLQAVFDSAVPLLLSTPIDELAHAGRTAWSAHPAPRWDHVMAVARAMGEVGLADRATTLLSLAAESVEVDRLAGRTAHETLPCLVVACGEHLTRQPDHDLAGALVDTTADVIAHLATRRRRRRRPIELTRGTLPPGDESVLRAAAVVFDQAGQARAAADATRAADRLAAGPPVEPPSSVVGADVVQRAMGARDAARSGSGTAAWRTLDALLDVASPTGAWPCELPTDLGEPTIGDRHSIAATAAIVSLAVALLVHDDDDHLSLLHAVPATWLGARIETHGLVTSLGTASYAVRWHADRPALLWEVAPTASQSVVGVSAPALDGDWHSHEPSGDALLSPIERLEPAPKHRVVISGLTIGRAAPPADRP